MEVHIGAAIEKKYEDSGLKLSEFAKRIDTGERNIYSIFKRKSIDSDLLDKISDALDFDFFSLYQRKPRAGDGYDLNDTDLVYTTRAKVQMMVELDGQDSTLDRWVNMLKKINAAIG